MTKFVILHYYIRPLKLIFDAYSNNITLAYNMYNYNIIIRMCYCRKVSQQRDVHLSISPNNRFYAILFSIFKSVVSDIYLKHF